MLWFDALVENVDRSWRNPNLLRWHRDLWLIDHGPCLYFHHAWAAVTDPATAHETYEYALLRVVPRIERGEYLNVGVLLHCRRYDRLAVRTALDAARLRALAPGVDLEAVTDAVAAVERSARGEGPAAVLSAGERFRWLTAPRSTVVQTGPVDTGLTADPDAETERLFALLVL